MSPISTPTYRVEYRDNHLALKIVSADCLSSVDRKPVHVMAWNGRPTPAKLEAWRVAYNASFATAGSNVHLAVAFGSIPHIYWARIVHQSNDEVVATVAAPAFEVV